MKIVTVIALSVAAALAAPALASASTYCVGSPSGGTCDVSNPGTAAGLQQALWGAEGSPPPDVVRIGPGTYTGNFVYGSASEVDVRGSGRDTIIKGVGTQPALYLSASGSSSTVSSLEVQMSDVASPACAVGLRIGSAVGQDLRVENHAQSCGAAVELRPDGDLRTSTVLAATAQGVEEQGGAGQHEVSDTFIAGASGLRTDAGSTWTMERIEVSAKHMGVSSGGTTTLRNSLVRVSGDPASPSATQALYKFGPGVLSADHVTIYAAPAVTWGAIVVITQPGTGTINMKNSIVFGSPYSTFARTALGGGTANIVVGHSNFAPPAAEWVDAGAGPGVFQQTPNGTNTNEDPKFVDPSFTLDSPTVNFRLRHDSPLIDKGEPGGLQGQDLAGELRLVDGDGVDGATRDLGAFEYQRRTPTAVIAAPGGGPFAVGAPVAFSAAGSGDPDAGDSLEYAWSFGDGTGAAGAGASHAYDSGGERTVTLTVTDPTGQTATATRALLVEGPAPIPGSDPGTGSGPGPGAGPADDLAPALASVALSAPAFRVDARAAAAGRVPRGTRVRFRLSEPASVRFTIRRRSGGRPIGSFVRSGGAGPNSVRFSGRLRVRGRTLSLAPGRYRLTLVATDAAGNRSAARRVSFRVVSAP
jgi:hypothetical protein